MVKEAVYIVIFFPNLLRMSFRSLCITACVHLLLTFLCVAILADKKKSGHIKDHQFKDEI